MRYDRRPLPEIIQLFSGTSAAEPLPGGQGIAVRSDNVVVKPVHEPEKYTWIAEVLQSVDSINQSVARPIRSYSEAWIEGGYGATHYLPGTFSEGRIEPKLAAAQAFHTAVAHIPKPPQFDTWTSRWVLAARAAWQETPLPSDTHPRSQTVISELFARYTPLRLPNQLIHTDLSGNILFHGDTPIIIDISPEFRPVAYADAVLVADSIAWFNEPLTSVDLLPGNSTTRIQLLLRAIVFRLCVPIFATPAEPKHFLEELDQFAPLIDYLWGASPSTTGNRASLPHSSQDPS